MSRWLTGLIMTALLASSFDSAFGSSTETTSSEIEVDYLVEAVTMKTSLLRDYETLLRIYYSLKKKTADPNRFPRANYNPSMANDPTIDPISRARFSEKTTDRLPEFSFGAYLELQEQLDRNPRLKENSFLKRLIEYGVDGQANDVFQRIGSYALAPYAQALDKDVRMDLYMNIGSSVSALALMEAQEVFKSASNKAGYPHNGPMVDPARKTEWARKVNAKAFELRKELRARGFTKTMRASKTPAAKGAARCAEAFRPLPPIHQ